jgi:hypothetical protein
LAKYLAHLLRPFAGKTSTFFKNSAHFVSICREMKVTESDLLVSFDVESLFTNIPVDAAVDTVKTLVPDGLPHGDLKMVDFCLQNPFFLWNGKFEQQSQGAAMGSPLSPVIAGLYMEKFEEEALETYEKKPKLFLRYMDDTFVIWQPGRKELDNFLRYLNDRK